LAKARGECGANEEIYIAEGSDWFWWYGDPHTEEFDFLFKGYIKKAYQTAGVKYSE
jgi:alpha-amylase/alpha-mannosidase (GH57 family)